MTSADVTTTQLVSPNVNQLSVETTLPIFWVDLGSFQNELRLAREAINELRVSHPDNTPSNVNSVYMSPWKSHRLNPKLLPLCDLVVGFAKRASLEHLNTNLERLNWGLQVTDCWGAVYEEADHTIAHSHFPSDFSGVVYLEADEDCAPIIFSNRLLVRPQPNMLIMFPGLLVHSVPENHGKRMIVAMNLHKFPDFSSSAPPAAASPAQEAPQAAPAPEPTATQ